MAVRLAAAKKRRIQELAGRGLSQRDVAKQAKTSLATVNRVLNERVAEAIVSPSATVAELRGMAPAERLEVQLSTLDEVLTQRDITPAIRSRLLQTYANLLERASKIRGREGKGERQFDGLSDLILSAEHESNARWSTDPANWLADAIPQTLPELHEIAGALDRVPVEVRKVTAERLRSVLHRILALLDAV